MEKEISDYILEEDCENFKKNVLSAFCELESKKTDLLKKYNKKSFWFFIVFIIFIFTAIFSSLVSFTQILPYFENIKFKTFSLFIISIAALIIIIFLFFDMRNKTNKEYTKMLKTKALKQLFQENNNIKLTENDQNKNCYKEAKTIKDNELNKSGLFLSYNERYTDDEFEGTYNGVPFKISETRMLNVQRNGKSTTYMPIFKGIIMSFDFNKKIKNRTIVSTKWDLTKKNESFIIMLFALVICANIFSKGEQYAFLGIGILVAAALFCFKLNQKMALDKVQLEDPKFAKRFNVYSSDQVEARYLVTPSFMERFYNLKTAFGARKIKCSFYDDKLMIAIYTNKNLFEIGSIFKSLEDPKPIENFYNELSSIYKMIDYFKLNENIYLK